MCELHEKDLMEDFPLLAIGRDLGGAEEDDEDHQDDGLRPEKKPKDQSRGQRQSEEEERLRWWYRWRWWRWRWRWRWWWWWWSSSSWWQAEQEGHAHSFFWVTRRREDKEEENRCKEEKKDQFEKESDKKDKDGNTDNVRWRQTRMTKTGTTTKLQTSMARPGQQGGCWKNKVRKDQEGQHDKDLTQLDVQMQKWMKSEKGSWELWSLLCQKWNDCTPPISRGQSCILNATFHLTELELVLRPPSEPPHSRAWGPKSPKTPHLSQIWPSDTPFFRDAILDPGSRNASFGHFCA